MRAGLALALMLTSGPALAQETGTRIGGRPAQVPDRGTMSNSDRARIWLERYAACVAKREPKRVAEVLDAAPGEASAAMGNLLHANFDSCLSTGGGADQLSMKPALLRGALYAERVGRTVRHLTPEEVATHPVAVPATASDVAELSMLRFGDCVMRQDPADSLAYVVADATTGMETKALDALRPALAGCIDTGASIKLSRSSIEAAVAEAIYRTVHAPVATAKTDGN